MKRKTPNSNKPQKDRKIFSAACPALGNCLLWSRSPKALMGKCPLGRGIQGRLGVRSFVCGCINCVLNKYTIGGGKCIILLKVFGSWPESSIPSQSGYFSKVDHMRWSLSVVSSFHFPWSRGWPPWGLGNTLFRWLTKSAVFKIEQLIRAWFYFYYYFIFVTLSSSKIWF